jgi:hypothetical protein
MKQVAGLFFDSESGGDLFRVFWFLEPLISSLQQCSYAFTWSGYKISGLIFLPTPCGLGNSERGGILACPLLSINPTTSKAAGYTLQPPAHAGSSLADFSTLKMEAIRSSETSVHTRSTWRHIPEEGILYGIILTTKK